MTSLASMVPHCLLYLFHSSHSLAGLASLLHPTKHMKKAFVLDFLSCWVSVHLFFNLLKLFQSLTSWLYFLETLTLHETCPKHPLQLCRNCLHIPIPCPLTPIFCLLCFVFLFLYNEDSITNTFSPDGLNFGFSVNQNNYLEEFEDLWTNKHTKKEELPRKKSTRKRNNLP